MATMTLTASDGHAFAAYEAKPAGAPRGGLVVVQEIFGVNSHIRSVVDRFAAQGYHAIAPAIFDRAERDVELGYDKEAVTRGAGIRQQIPIDQMLLDIAAARDAVASSGKVGIVGYCLGGSLAWLAASRLPGFSAAIGYYGGMVAKNLDESPRCPVLLHFGEQDGGIPVSDVESIRAAVDPAIVQVYSYAGAGHAFNRDGNHAWHEPSAKLALERTMELLHAHVG